MKGRKQFPVQREPEIKNCSCHRNHWHMPFTSEYDEWGTEFRVEHICRTHTRHFPCRECMKEDRILHYKLKEQSYQELFDSLEREDHTLSKNQELSVAS